MKAELTVSSKVSVAAPPKPRSVGGALSVGDLTETVPTGPSIRGKLLEVNGDPFWAAGVTYGSFAANDEGEPFPPYWRLRDDFAQMRDAGINTVRLYSPPTDRIADAAHDFGLYLVPDICWGPRYCELDDPERMKFIRSWTRGHAERLANHPAMLMYSVGNEVPPLITRWYGRERIERFIREQYDICKEVAPNIPVTYCNHPPTEYLNLPFLDVVSYNIYLEREVEFRKYLSRLQVLAGERPIFLSEIGLDSHEHGLDAQADSLNWQLNAAIEKGACGVALYAWTDEWSIYDNDIEGWAFGLTDKDRKPKPALSTVEKIYKSDRYAIRDAAWPKVSVVVASYNGGETLGECLSALETLNYPDFEVILIDDGSTDHTAALAKEYPHARYIGVPNGGLSNAQNLGINAAQGEIVAFIDSDAFPHPDWLYFLVTVMEEKNAMAAGGPNLLPPKDGFTAQCIDFAPGNPTHVLIDNDLAEHVPGCNMAFRKDVLEEIGLFDPTHRTAGDDVDVCWKLLVRDKKIAFSPCAIVWHHRRPTVRKFLKQQSGYGYAESHLQRRYPGRFNIFGDLVWKGGIYDSPCSALQALGIPKLFRPRVYYGRYGGGMFQSIYQPFMNWWFQVFTTAEWQSLTWCMLSAGIVAMATGGMLSGWVLNGLAIIMFGATLGAAAVPAIHAAKQKRWKGWQRVKGLFLVGTINIIQPIARAWGRVKGWWASRDHDGAIGTDVRVWGNISQRHEWLESLQNHLRDCGWIGQEGDDWDEADIEVTGPGPYKVKLISTCEEILEEGRHYVRYRVWTKAKRIVPILWAVIGATIPAFVLFPFLLPLAVPMLIVVWFMANARHNMASALSHLALEVAEAQNMPRVEEDR